jgi:alpha-mannosidase
VVGKDSSGDRPPRLYIVAVSHLDTQWRWTVRDVIKRFLPRTLRENFALFEVFPDYVLSFEGAFRYMLAEEYYPEEFEQLKRWIEKGRWRIAGSMIDAPDVNLASPESLIRHVLYGSRYFRQRFGRTSVDIFLPDCFGFPFSLPTIAAHCGLVGFSSQKFNKWMGPSKVPFDLGQWEGPDSSRLIAALKPGGYAQRLTEDLSRSRRWRKRLSELHEATGWGVAMKYFGVGDRGGSPDEASLFWLARSISSTEAMEVIHSGSDQLFRDLDEEEVSSLPVYRGELLLLDFAGDSQALEQAERAPGRQRRACRFDRLVVGSVSRSYRAAT